MNGQNLLTASDIFSGGENPYTPLEIPEIVKNGQPGVVYLKPLSTKAVIKFSKSQKDDNREDEILPLIVQALVNPDGTPIFRTEEDLARLQEMSMPVFNRISRAVMAQIRGKDDTKEASESNKNDENGGAANDNPLEVTTSESPSTLSPTN